MPSLRTDIVQAPIGRGTVSKLSVFGGCSCNSSAPAPPADTVQTGKAPNRKRVRGRSL